MEKRILIVSKLRTLNINLLGLFQKSASTGAVAVGRRFTRPFFKAHRSNEIAHEHAGK